MKRIFLTLLTIPLLFSCTKIIEFDGEVSKPKLVVNSIVTPDSTFKVNVSESRFFLDNAPMKKIEDATVKILSQEGTLLATLSHTDKGNYEGELKPTINTNYRVEVVAPNFDKASASMSIVPSIPITSFDTLSVFEEYDFNLSTTIHFSDPGNERNYYRVRGDIQLMEIDPETGELRELERYIPWFYIDDPVINGAGDDDFVENEYNPYNLFNDDLINGKAYSLTIPLHLYGSGNIFIVHLFLESLSEEYYTYLKSVSEYQESGDNPFTEPVPIYSNIENGIGFFGGYSSSEIVIEVREKEWNR
ncbi:MAG: hypothetical protein CSA95_07970 [Bacteroidetes bacterium]|nr:MAG: hypothetical protein CSA95_07970 [Bacteroidota bacterium]PIE88219.1 MAG: hypothetical protein CSA04_03040 [Bacteroidota bacterium]